ncbi:MAG: penicillin-binding transpeptidase domain-containing protein, partial [Candidatus Saccharimonadales bacterium]
MVVIIFIARLFYLQVIQHDYYKTQALNDQLKEYVIAADRGVIQAHQGSDIVPIVLNEKLYTLYADPLFIEDSPSTAAKVAAITDGDPKHYTELMKTPKSRYAVLTKRVSEAHKKQIAALKLPGVGLQAQLYRTYPQKTLAAQLLGFVNNEGKGTYGIEQALDKDLAGVPGRLKAVTDARGVPLVASKDNIQIDPKPGKDVVLTIDLAMQKELENHLKAGLARARSKSGSALIMDPYTGAIKAMANYPTYDPAEYFKVKDASLFTNAAVARPLEVGSSMKVLTTAAALDQGVIKPDTTYNDPGRWTLNGHVIKNVEESAGSGPRNISQLLNLSLNTGATWMLMQMGGG